MVLIALQQRREHEELRITAMQTEMGRMEKELEVEIRRRTESNRALQTVSSSRQSKAPMYNSGNITLNHAMRVALSLFGDSGSTNN